MKRLSVLVPLVALILFSSNTFAFTVFFDADGSLGSLSATLTDSLRGGATDVVKINQSFGGDDLGNGDTFTESFILNLDELLLNDLDPFTPYSTNITTANLTATITNLEGHIANFLDIDSSTPINDSITDTTILNKLMSEVNYSVIFDPGNEIISLSNVHETIGTFMLTQGGADNIAYNNPTATFDFGLTMQALTLNEGYFFKNNNGVIGEDWANLINDEVFFLSLADSSINPQFSLNTTEGDDKMSIYVADNGTTVRFNVVPEPSTFLLLGCGLAGLGLLARRRKQ